VLHSTRRPIDALTFERHFGRETSRANYNIRSARKAERAGGPVFCEHNGLSDLWVPLRQGRAIFACLAAGPFWLEPPDAETIARCYERLSGKPPRENDPTFSSYLRTMLDTAVLDEALRRDMVKFGTAFTDLVAGTTDARTTFQGLERLLRHAEQRGPNDKMWDTARALTDRFENPTLLSYHGRGTALDALGVSRLGTDVLAALPIHPRQPTDAVQAQVRGRQFQNDCLEFTVEIPSSLIGRLGDDGVFMIAHTPRRVSGSQRRSAIRNVANRLRRFAARRGVELCIGIAGRGVSPTEIPDRYADALLALEWAMHAREPLVFFEDHANDLVSRSRTGFYSLVRDLRIAFERGSIAALDVELERFIKEVLRRTIGDVDAARAYFEAIYAELLSSLEQRSVVAADTIAHLSRQFQAHAQGAKFLHELSSLFAQSIRQLATTAIDPAKADRAERLDRARALLDRSFAEPLRLAWVAKRAGLSPAHFSRAFKRHTGVGFERYLLEHRVAHAKDLLRSTELPVYRIAVESGFTSYVHFARAFRRLCKTSAREFRRRDAV
jgi:AraC-like DNA-binding protein